ncbi:LPS-assembly protein LptD [uncultured Cohaesibacter sp.]|uniref:LPS-assembly protein LptD n=1 Tax=uncultured Cohaesibacter sp. TaxID=1002546 RepID=UPI002931552C|nr:LPS-assembly protein LptD [uncultured Cohaesibacter sp.]
MRHTVQIACLKNTRSSGSLRLMCASLMASVFLFSPVSLVPSDARDVEAAFNSLKPADDTPMLVEADEMVYDYDNEKVSAIGNVQIYYGDYTLQADKVIYDQKSGRLIADGNVCITEPDGNVLTANFVDITEDFRTGFVRSLRVQTTENARFAADKAERKGDDITVFDKGVYTTCDACEANPKKPPLWQIKASRIIYNSKDKMVYYKAAKFEFMGVPLLYTPYLAHPDPSRKRSSGLLAPRGGYKENLGYYGTPRYFWALSDSYDITFEPTYYSQQGFLASATWRQHLGIGTYSVRAMGISQQDKDAFEGTSSSEETLRGSVESAGELNITNQWKFGWDVAVLSDKLFLRDYDFTNDKDRRSSAYLIGQGERNYFEARASYYNIMTDSLDQGEQAVVHPSIDYNAYSSKPLLGGEGRLQVNSTSLTRDQLSDKTVAGTTRTLGVAGTYNRTTVEASWKRRFIAPGGQLITPFSSLRGDFYWMPSRSGAPAALVDESIAFRGMPTIGVDYRLPILATTGSTSHIIEPIAQVVVRPNEAHIGDLPNDDAQSLIFDDSILFDPNKFSGYDRVEGGTRANVGFQYRMQLANGWSLGALGGRSYHLAGKNSFAEDDLTSTGLGSGLDKDHSDYVARVSVSTDRNIHALARGRFDPDTADLKYAAVAASGSYDRYSGSLAYIYNAKRPEAGVDKDSHEISTTARVKFADYWALTGTSKYDLSNDAFVKGSLALKYEDECFAVSLKYSQTRDVYSDTTSDQTVMLQFNFKSLAEGQISYTAENDD